MKKHHSRMLRVFLFHILGFFIHEVSGETNNSTQMYYIKLTMEESAVANVSRDLLNKDYGINNYTLNDLKKTMVCDPVNVICSCENEFEWSEAACSSKYKCCGNSDCKTKEFTCISIKTVTLTGFLTLKSDAFHGCLDDEKTDNFRKCNKNLSLEIKTCYSQIYGFETLTIKKYRTGSVIVEFEVIVVSTVEPDLLKNISDSLTDQLKAILNLETTGVVHFDAPQDLVEANSNAALTCRTDTDLGQNPHWELKKSQNYTIEITNGTEATITSKENKSTIQLRNVSLLWTGRYTCSYKQGGAPVTINHKASAVMDVCVKPEVVCSTSPGFPRCFEPTDLPSVIINCEIKETYEKYNVSWGKINIDAKILPKQPYNETGMTVFSAQTFVACLSTDPIVKYKITNRCGQVVQQKVKVILIKVNDTFCEKEEGTDWTDTKAGEEAFIKCKQSVGRRTRQCYENGTWGKETSMCVNLELQNVLSKAQICDIGQGKLENNAENVFSGLQLVTNNIPVINSVANLDASVNVIHTMTEKLGNLSDETSVKDFLVSSSNLMDQSLKHSWESVEDHYSSKDLAEEYLKSVEELIDKAHIAKKGIAPNLEVESCNKSDTRFCNNTVFNNTVKIESQGTASIKTTGFRQLDQYLPNEESNFSPNSIVVSTTMNPKNNASTVKIQIDFQLMRSRPRNTELKCVFWNTTIHKWSKEGCEWVGSSEKGVCECTHLSAFAILMSKEPLQVPYLKEVTYVGLAVSIISLIICLAVELILWSDVVKTDTLHLRHCAHVNISICLLVGDVCFLASSLSGELTDVWCKTLVVVEHFCYLAMFFWMFCLSSILLHKTVYLSLHGIGKTAYLRYSIIVGYICPLLIVAITFIANNAEEGRYYSKETRWLVYNGTLKGSIFTFILPVGIIVFLNVFFMCLVIMKLLQPIKATQIMTDKEKNSAKTVIRSVILLTPVFGITWGFGFMMILIDLTEGPVAYGVNYIFTIMNAFQGLYIFLSTCAGDRMVREGLRKYFQKKFLGVSTVSASCSTVDEPSVKK